jgi:hypothetical protein
MVVPPAVAPSAALENVAAVELAPDDTPDADPTQIHISPDSYNLR